jgi:hypothetical protein
MSTPTLVHTSTDAPHPFVVGLLEGRADAATTTPDITTVRFAWITEFADAEYADGYRAGLDFDRGTEAAFRTRRGRA